jgi:DNA ligase 1
MHFEELTNAFERLETAAGRLAMYRVLEELFARADAREIAAVAYLCTGRLLPAFTGVELGMGERLVAAAIAFATGRSQPEIDELYGQLGDLGMVAQRLLVAQPRKHCTV